MISKVSKVNLFVFCFPALLLFMFSCNNSRRGGTLYNPTYVFDSFKHFWSYWYYNVNLSQNYIAFDTNNKRVSKKAFLKQIATGNYLPIKLKSEDPTSDRYRLIRIPPPVDREGEGIYRYLVFFGRLNLEYLNMEDKPVPKFCFHALNGKIYTNENCKGKFIVLDCWFVGCHACVTDMPEINKLVEKYNDKDIIFIGLALNSKESVKRFLTKIKLRYTVVPEMQNFIEDSLKVIMYPTYVIVNKKGNFISFPGYAKNLKSALNQLAEAGKLSVN